MKTMRLRTGVPSACLVLVLACASRAGFAEETVPEDASGASSKLLLRGAKDETPPEREAPVREARAENKKTYRAPDDFSRAETVRAETVKPEAAESAEIVRVQEPDLIGDRPAPRASTDPALTSTASQQLLEEMPAPGPLTTKARQCYKLLGELKSNAEKISTGLDDGGKEVTLLIRISDDLSTNVTDLADLWPEHKTFVDYCAVAKRQSIILNEELSRVPRNWRALRWSLNSALVHVGKLRHVARDLADAEPKPVATQGKDGKIVYSDPEPEPLDPVLAKREAAVSEARRAREMIKKQEEEKKKKRMPTDLKPGQ